MNFLSLSFPSAVSSSSLRSPVLVSEQLLPSLIILNSVTRSSCTHFFLLLLHLSSSQLHATSTSPSLRSLVALSFILLPFVSLICAAFYTSCHIHSQLNFLAIGPTFTLTFFSFLIIVITSSSHSHRICLSFTLSLSLSVSRSAGVSFFFFSSSPTLCVICTVAPESPVACLSFSSGSAHRFPLLFLPSALSCPFILSPLPLLVYICVYDFTSPREITLWWHRLLPLACHHIHQAGQEARVTESKILLCKQQGEGEEEEEEKKFNSRWRFL